MNASDVLSIVSSKMNDVFNLNPPVNAAQICDWLIWANGVYWNPDVMPMYQGTMTQRMNEIAMDMILKGEY